MMKNCNNCAWYCHSDGKCYGNSALRLGIEIGISVYKPLKDCPVWASDGLTDYERETMTLMTMETE